MGSILKSGGSYTQGLYEVSATQLAPLGAILDLEDGRLFRYGQAGAVALSAGHVCQSGANVADHQVDQALDTPATGARVVTVTLGATAVTANQYADGYLVFDATIANGGGSTHKILSHPAAALSTSVAVTLYDPLWEDIIAASTGSLIAHPAAGIVVKPASAATAPVIGVPVRDVPISNFAWFQFRGICGVLANGAVVAGNSVIASITVIGACEAPAGVYAITTTDIGRVRLNVATTQFAVIDLNIL